MGRIFKNIILSVLLKIIIDENKIAKDIHTKLLFIILSQLI